MINEPYRMTFVEGARYSALHCPLYTCSCGLTRCMVMGTMQELGKITAKNMLALHSALSVTLQEKYRLT